MIKRKKEGGVIMLVYLINFHIKIKHLNDILLNCCCKISVNKPLTANPHRRLEKNVIFWFTLEVFIGSLKKICLLCEMFLEVTL